VACPACRKSTLVPTRRSALDGSALHIRQAAWTDPFPFRWGIKEPSADVDRDALRPGSGVWDVPKLLLNRPLADRATGETRPAEIMTLDPLPYGSQLRDRRNLAMRTGTTLEIRVPWSLLGFADPSTHTLIDPQPDGTIGAKQLSSKTPVRIQLFGKTGTPLTGSSAVTWRSWRTVQWHERRKAGWSALRSAFARESR
jgi:hypothetical protein